MEGPNADHERGTRRRPPASGLGELGRKQAGAGVTFAATIVAFSLGGWALDGVLGTLPLFLLLGFAVGSVGGFVWLVETVSPGMLFRRRGRRK